MENYVTPREMMFPQHFTTNPGHQSGFHYNSHLSHHKVWCTARVVDHLYWGRELGMATNVHRNQRTSFDFNDTVIPTTVPSYAQENFKNQDPSIGPHPDLSKTHNPHHLPFNYSVHAAHIWRPAPNAPDYSLPTQFERYQTKLGIFSNSSVGNHDAFKISELPDMFRQDNYSDVHMDLRTVAVPGIDLPYYGEFDRMNMLSMAAPLNRTNTVCLNEGRYSAILYLNTPQEHSALDTSTAYELGNAIDRFTNHPLKKLTVLKAAQCGLTDRFCSGYSIGGLARAMRLRESELARVKSLAKPSSSGVNPLYQGSLLLLSKSEEEAAKKADDYLQRAVRHVRSMTTLLWKVFSASRPLMVIANGSCFNVGCGMALLSKYPVLRDSTELICDGPNVGITPFGGMLHFLARSETSVKYPGLAEFITLTGAPLYSGDALRLGWSDLFTTLPDVDYHVKDWFDSTEHIHNDAVTWQLGYLLDSAFRLDPETHSPSMERVAVTKTRAQWISEVFADQDTVEGILNSLTLVEQLPRSDPNNTTDEALSNPFTIDVRSAVQSLRSKKLVYTMAPWELTPLPKDMDFKPSSLNDAFNHYYFELEISKGRSGTRLSDPKFDKWKEFRAGEMASFKAAQLSNIRRHVYVKLDGLDGKIVSFDYDFVFPDKGDVNYDRAAVLKQIITKAGELLGMSGRDMSLGWCLPTCDAARVRHDEELLMALLNDPGYEDPSKKLAFPPIYFVAHRNQLHFSEWAYSTKHILLGQCPAALKVSLKLLQTIRGDGTDQGVLSVSKSLALERRVFIRMMQRPDFYNIGAHFGATPEELQSNKEASERSFGQLDAVDPESVFESDVKVISGHTFHRRPKWSPRLIEEVDDAIVQDMMAPLDFEKSGVGEVDIPSETYKRKHALNSMEDAVIQVVPRLGTNDAPNKKTDAKVPDNVNFYEMARHPWLEHATSWRMDGYTEGSMQYFTENYKHAEKQLYGSQSGGTRMYWPPTPQQRRQQSRDAMDDDQQQKKAPDQRGDELLRDNFWSVVEAAEHGVSDWMIEAKKKAKSGKFAYRKELATSEEKVYDDRYYQWFIQPGKHPNPSLLLKK